MGDVGGKTLKYDFDGKTALVTGGAAGLGRVIACAFARQGASVVVADINLAGAEETVRHIEAGGGTGASVRTDVASEEDVKASVAVAVDRYGTLDFACNNAGIASARLPIAELPRDRWDRIVAVNLTGVFQCLKYEL